MDALLNLAEWAEKCVQRVEGDGMYTKSHSVQIEGMRQFEPGSVIQARQSLRDFSMEGKVVPVELMEGRGITISRSGVGIHRQREGFISWTREEAVTAAKSILEYYGEE